MNQQTRSIVCGQNDVIQIIYDGNRSFFNHCDTFRVSSFLQRAKTTSMHRSPSMNSEEAEKFFIDGLNCEYLQIGTREWRKGKIKIKLEFYPDDAETNDTNLEQNGSSPSDLDGIRQLLDEKV